MMFKVFESIVVVRPPIVVTKRYSPLFDQEISNPTKDLSCNFFIGWLDFAISHIRSSAPYPIEAINLSSSLTFAQ